MSEFKKELEGLINKHSKENGSNTPDFMLAKLLSDNLDTFDEVLQMREGWFSEAEEEAIQEPDVSDRLTLMEEFSNTDELLQNSALFNVVFEQLLRGGNIFHIIESLVMSNDKMGQMVAKKLMSESVRNVVEVDDKKKYSIDLKDFQRNSTKC